MTSKDQTQTADKAAVKQKSPTPAVDGQTRQEVPLGALVQRARFEPHLLTPKDVLQLQRISGNRAVSSLLTGAAQPAGQTELPDALKTGIEDLSGFSMDDVKVHYNSEKPAQLNALAYAQGSEIHVAPGQEKHLPHEAWHVVQQKQGRVKPTLQLKGSVNVNDDAGLENEADLMGVKSVQLKTHQNQYASEHFTANQIKLNNSAASYQLKLSDFFKSKTPKEKFLDKKFAKKNHTPSTGLGLFDAEYQPKTGKLNIILRVNFNFQDLGAYESQATKKEDAYWTDEQKKAWKTNFYDSILSKWGNISPITCTKEGYEDVTATPTISFKEETSNKAAWNLEIGKSITKKSDGKKRSTGFSGVSIEDNGKKGKKGKGSFQEMDNIDKIKDQHLVATEKTTNIDPAYLRDKERLTSVLNTIGDITFKSATADLQEGMKEKLVAAAKKINALGESSALADKHDLIIKTTISSSKNARVGNGRAEAIKSIFTQQGVKNNVTVVILPNTKGSKANVETGPESDLMKELYKNNWSRITAAHEFGHMIGLLDEYCPAVSPELLLKLHEAGKIDTATPVTTEFAKGKEGNKNNKQTNYANLLKDSGLKAQDWARPTATVEEKSTSLMSGGFELLKQHTVTFWEVLTELTKNEVGKEHWKI